MANPVLGRAYIDVHANTEPFAREMERDLKTIVDGLQPVADKQSQKIGTSIATGVKKGIKKQGQSIWAEFRDIWVKNAKRDQNVIVGSARALGESFGLGFRRAADLLIGDKYVTRVAKSFESNSSRSIFSRAGRNLGALLGHGITGGLSRGVSGLGEIVKSIGSSVANVGSKSPLGLVAGIAIIGLIPAIIGGLAALLNLLGPLVNIIAALPGLVFVLVAAFAPLITAFQGFGEAIGAIMDGDPEKIAEALKKLTPAARSVAKEFQGMLPAFREIKAFAQEKFFAQIAGQLTPVMAALGPIFRIGFGRVAEAFGSKFVTPFLKFLSSPFAQKFFQMLFDFTASLAGPSGTILIQFVAALMEMTIGAFPFLTKLFNGLAALATTFREFIGDAVKNGDFQAFLDKFWGALNIFNELAKSGYNFFKTLIGGTDENNSAYRLFLAIKDGVDSLTEFFKSEIGKQSLEGMVTLAGTFLAILLGAIVAVGLIAAGFQSIVDLIQWIIDHTPSWLTGANQNHLNRVVRHQASTQGFQGFASGGIVDQEQMAMVGEGNRPEAIIPLTDPARAKQLADESGLTQMLSGGNTEIHVYIGDEEVMARVEKRVQNGFTQYGRSMKYGPRPLGVTS
jgi:hypothetical protein